MTTSVFIKTCERDLEWLKYGARSIQRFGWGFDEVVVVADESCNGKLGGLPTVVSSVHYVPEWPDGRIQQQAYKLLADTYTKSEFILFTDSDCLFNQPFSESNFMRDGKPVLLKIRYELAGDSRIWKIPTQSFVGWDVEWEYMRRMPMMFRRDTLTAAREMFPEWQERLKTVDDNMFSEFNVLGAFVERHEPEKYFISDTEAWVPDAVARQFWSWGGITPEVQAEIKSILHEKS